MQLPPGFKPTLTRNSNPYSSICNRDYHISQSRAVSLRPAGQYSIRLFGGTALSHCLRPQCLPTWRLSRWSVSTGLHACHQSLWARSSVIPQWHLTWPVRPDEQSDSNFCRDELILPRQKSLPRVHKKLILPVGSQPTRFKCFRAKFRQDANDSANDHYLKLATKCLGPILIFNVLCFTTKSLWLQFYLSLNLNYLLTSIVFHSFEWFN